MADTGYRLLAIMVAGALLGACAASQVAPRPDDPPARQVTDQPDAAPPDRPAPSNEASENQQADADAAQPAPPVPRVGVGIAPIRAPSRLSTYCNVGNGRGCPVRAARVGAACRCGAEPGVVMPR